MIPSGRLGGWLLLSCGLAVWALAAPPAPALIAFQLESGPAETTLSEFARASGEQIAYLIDQVSGQRTAAVRGRMTPFTALQRMVAGTALTVHRDRTTGALTVIRRPPPPPPGPGRAPAPLGPGVTSGAGGSDATEDRILTLAEFVVSSPSIDRYRSADAISGFRVRTDLSETPGSISIMTRAAIDDLAPLRLFDVTRYVAGVQEGRGIQFSDRQIIRGFESNGRTVDNFFQDSADNFDEALVERIEVTKGPNAILAPAGVPGGSINVITKSPLFTPSHSLAAQVGRFDAQKITADFTGPVPAHPTLAYRWVGALQDSRRYWATDARLRGRVFAPMLAWRPTADTALTVKLVHAAHWTFREPGLILDPTVTFDTANPGLAPGFRYRSRNGIQPWSHVGTASWDLFAQLTSHLNDHLSLRVALNGRTYFEDSMQEFFSTPSFRNRYNPFTGELTPDLIWQRDPGTDTFVPQADPYFDPRAVPVRGDVQATRRTTVNAQADLAASYRLGSAKALTVLGAAVTHYDNHGRTRSGVLPPIDLAQPDRLARPVWADDLYLDLQSKQNAWSSYLNQRLSFGQDRLHLTSGVMLYRVYTRSINRALAEPEFSELDGSRQLWLTGLVIKPSPALSLYYSHSTNSTPVIANELPLWRDGRQHEIGLKHTFFDQRLAFTAAWFRISQTNVVVPNPERLTNPDAPEQLISNLSDDGMEFELTGGITPNLSIVASYAQLQLRDSLGRPVRAVADENAALLLNYRWPSLHRIRIAGTLGLTYAGRRPGDTTAVNFTPLGVTTRQSFQVPALTLLNLGLALRRDPWQVRLNLDNVADVRDRIVLAGGRVSGTGLTTATGRNLRLSVSHEF